MRPRIGEGVLGFADYEEVKRILMVLMSEQAIDKASWSTIGMWLRKPNLGTF